MTCYKLTNKHDKTQILLLCTFMLFPASCVWVLGLLLFFYPFLSSFLRHSICDRFLSGLQEPEVANRTFPSLLDHSETKSRRNPNSNTEWFHWLRRTGNGRHLFPTAVRIATGSQILDASVQLWGHAAHVEAQSRFSHTWKWRHN